MNFVDHSTHGYHRQSSPHHSSYDNNNRQLGRSNHQVPSRPQTAGELHYTTNTTTDNTSSAFLLPGKSVHRHHEAVDQLAPLTGLQQTVPSGSTGARSSGRRGENNTSSISNSQLGALPPIHPLLPAGRYTTTTNTLSSSSRPQFRQVSSAGNLYYNSNGSPGVQQQPQVSGGPVTHLPIPSDLSPVPNYRLLHHYALGSIPGSAVDPSQLDLDGRSISRHLPSLESSRSLPGGVPAAVAPPPPPLVTRTSNASVALQHHHSSPIRNHAQQSPVESAYYPQPPAPPSGISLSASHSSFPVNQERYLQPQQYPSFQPSHSYSSNQQRQHLHSSPFGHEDSVRRDSLGSNRLLTNDFDSNYHPFRPLTGPTSPSGATSLQSRPSITINSAPSLAASADPLRSRYPTPGLKYLLLPGTPQDQIPSEDFAYSLITSEEARYRAERQIAGQTGEEFVFEPREPIVYAAPGSTTQSQYDPCPSLAAPPPSSSHHHSLDQPGPSTYQTHYQSGEMSGPPSLRASQRRQAPRTGGIISGSNRQSTSRYAESVGSRRSTATVGTGTAPYPNVQDLPIVRSTRAKVYRKDMVTVDGRAHSVTIVDDDSSTEPGSHHHAAYAGQKRKVGGAPLTSTATTPAAPGGGGGGHLTNGMTKKRRLGETTSNLGDNILLPPLSTRRTSARNAHTGGGSVLSTSTVGTTGTNTYTSGYHQDSNAHYSQGYATSNNNNHYNAPPDTYGLSGGQYVAPTQSRQQQYQGQIPPAQHYQGQQQLQSQQVGVAPTTNVARSNMILPPAVPGSTTATTSESTEPPPWDDKDGHYVIIPGHCMGENDKYKIVRLLGQGTFGKVVEAQGARSFKRVAIKIIRAVPKYREASSIEIRVLKRLRDKDPDNRYKCISLLEFFDFRNHICLVTPLLGQSVFDFLKGNKFQPFPEAHIQSFAKDLLTSLSFVHSLNLIHTDLKPENILLVSNGYYTLGERVKGAHQKHILQNVDIRLIDFGSATFDNEFHSSVVSTRHYRAPEIILGLGWSFPCDMFSVGCILVEFYTGDALFQTHNNLEHLAMMEAVMGKIPAVMSKKARAIKGEFFKGTQIDYPNSQTTRNSKNYVKKMKKLADIIRPKDDHHLQFCDLIKRLLDWNPAKRIAVNQAARHPYFKTLPPPPPPDPAAT